MRIFRKKTAQLCSTDSETEDLARHRNYLKTRPVAQHRPGEQQDDKPERSASSSFERAAAALLHWPTACPGTIRSA